MPEQSTAHSPFGGSVAARVLHCPGSVKLVEKVPAHLRRTSAFAERGTALHAAMALLIDDLDAGEARLEGLVGTTFGNYTITADDVENALRPVYAYVERLLDAPGAEFYLEQRVEFPTVPGAFGTADLVIRIGTVLHVVDFKFGVGVRVLALTPVATTTWSIRSCCSTPRLRGIRCLTSSPASPRSH
jgi:hypothetical protein